ncbi:MAG TPA: hypothetical protein VGT98_02165, partial [Candidatus Elarobacter sp.]|nr:hypothetical protein [Candidatus Elarobacter sp.]
MLPREVPQPWRAATVAALAVAAIVATAAGACASAGGRSGPTHPVDVEVQNNLALPTLVTIYAVPEFSSARMLLGDVPPAATRTLSFTPISYTTTYRLYAQRPQGRPVRSQPFNVGSGMTGTIVWTMF